MGAPQIILICVLVFELGMMCVLHGKPRDNLNCSMYTYLVANVILFGLLVWGGFFSKYGLGDGGNRRICVLRV
jgi:hypothetical protein